LAKHGVELAELAEKNNCVLGYEAAVAGGIPVIKALSEGLAANNIYRINGILNGTCNFILTEMETKGAGYEETLRIAQELGYAEADPTFDVEGIDAAQKLSLLSAIAFGQKPNENDVTTRGISDVAALDFEFAEGFGAVIRLIARAEKKIIKDASFISSSDGGIVQAVEPCLVRKSSVLSGISGVTNAVQFETDMVDVMLQGPGAGGEATASAVLADIADLNQFIKSGMQTAPYVFGRNISALVDSHGETEVMPSQWYIRLSLKDAPGSMARVTSILAEHEVSIEEAVQRGPQNGEDHRPVVFITHKCEKSAIKNALEALEAIDVIAKDVNYMPVI
jgi:homoserine dehydrogenase